MVGFCFTVRFSSVQFSSVWFGCQSIFADGGLLKQADVQSLVCNTNTGCVYELCCVESTDRPSCDLANKPTTTTTNQPSNRPTE